IGLVEADAATVRLDERYYVVVQLTLGDGVDLTDVVGVVALDDANGASGLEVVDIGQRDQSLGWRRRRRLRRRLRNVIVVRPRKVVDKLIDKLLVAHASDCEGENERNGYFDGDTLHLCVSLQGVGVAHGPCAVCRQRALPTWVIPTRLVEIDDLRLCDDIAHLCASFVRFCGALA